MLATAQPSSA